MRGSRGKYKPEVIEAIVTAIAKTGRDKDGYTAGGITSSTYYKWLSDYSDFDKKVQEAKKNFRKTCPEVLRKKALNSLAEYVNKGEVTSVQTEEIVEVPDANGGFQIKERRTTQKTFKKPLPQWVADRILGKNLPLIEAVQILVMNGVATADQAAIVESCLAEMERQLKDSAQRTTLKDSMENLLPQ